MASSRSVALVITLVACATPTQPATPIALAVEGAVFDHGAPIPFVISNSGPNAAFVSACGVNVTTLVERRGRGTWEPYAGGACLAIYLFEPLRLAPGATIAATIQIPDAGSYRLKLQAGTDPTRLVSVTSSSFEVR